MDNLSERLNNLPVKSGVYEMLDEFGGVLYVGKAKNLKRRVKQYFHGNNRTEKTLALVARIADFRYTVTPTEVDALVLENNLIKLHHPQYNILLKDDKTYPYIKINVKQDFPKIEIARRIKADGAKYFGPYMLGVRAGDIIELIQSVFLIRSCKNGIGKVKRECLNYHIGRCLAPCCGHVTKEEYAVAIKKAISFLNGEEEEVSDIILKKMQFFADNEEFETALYYRDKLELLRLLQRKQNLPFKQDLDLDIFSYATNGMFAVVNVMIVRGGKQLGGQSFSINDVNGENALSSYIMQYYDNNPILCDEVIISSELEFSNEIADYLSHKKGSRINVVTPIGGIRRQIADICQNNASEYLDKQAELIFRKEELTLGGMEQLGQYLNLSVPPKRIECYDVSNIGGTDKVVGMVVFINGEKAIKHYRRFKIETVVGANDFACMKEGLSRRFMRLLNDKEDISFGEKPDLLVIDGGKGQLSMAVEAMEENGLSLNIISLAKREEEVFVPGRSESIILPRNSVALKLLIRVRDETHRFSVEYHRTLRQKRQTLSRLTKIPGVGAERAKQLLIHFKTIENIEKADVEKLISVKGISKATAEVIYNYFRKVDDEV